MDPIADLHRRLNAAKDSLARPDFDQLKKQDPFERRVKEIRQELADRAGAQNLTKAGLKMLEILTQTKLGAHLLSLPSVRAFYNAELPGSFVYATNHYLKSNGKTLDWMIASYLPQNDPESTHLKDIFGLMKGNPERVVTGAVKTNRGEFWVSGDLTNPKMPAILAQLVRKGPHARWETPGVDLYTADGGFDVSGRENEQEVLSYPLIQGEIETGFLVLKPGGAMVIKIFTFFTPEMMALLLKVMRSFQDVVIYKPPSSTPLNSESYLVAIGYKGQPPKMSPQEILSSATPNEIEYLMNRLSQLFEKQIIAINRFSNRQPNELPKTPQLKPLLRSDWI